MGFFDKMFFRKPKKSQESLYYNTGSVNSYNKQLNIEDNTYNSDIYAVTDLVSKHISALPIKVDSKNTDLYYLDKILNKAANKYLSSYDLWTSVMTECMINGQSFVEIVRGIDGKILCLEKLPYGNVTCTTNDDNTFIEYIVKKCDENNVTDTYVYDNTEILHFKYHPNFDDGGLISDSPLVSVIKEIETDDAISENIKKFIKTGLAYNILNHEKIGTSLTPDSKKALSKMFNDSILFDDLFVLDGTQKFESVNHADKLKAMLDADTVFVKAVSKVYGIPLQFLGQEQANSSNAELNKQLATALKNYIHIITKELQFKLNLIFEDDINVVGDVTSLMTDKDEESKMKLENKKLILEMVKAGMLTKEEALIEIDKINKGEI